SVPPADFLRLALLATGVFAVIRGRLLLCCLVGSHVGLGLVVRLLLGLRVGLRLGLGSGLAGLVRAAGDRLLLVEQARHDRLVGAQVTALAHAGALADPAAQVVQLGAAHVAASGDLDALDLRRVHGERPLHAYAEGLLAHGERLPDAVALTLEDDALEDLGPAPRALDDLEMHANTVPGPEPGDPPQLRPLEAVDDAAHDGWGG